MLLQTLCEGKLTTSAFEGVFDKECDVCVVGLGTAGAISAISSARHGCSVIGVERTSYLGGLGSAACVWDYFYGTQGGIAIGINEECYKRIADSIYAPSGGRDIRDESLPSIIKDTVLREHALRYGCELLLETVAVGVYIEENTICGVKVYDGSKYTSIKCDCLIDGTDGVVCRLAGCEFSYGRPRDHHTMQFSHLKASYGNRMVRGGWSLGGYPDCDTPMEWSRLILRSAPTYRDGRTVFEGEIIGTREVPTVITDEVYTLEDYIDGKSTDKPLFYGFSLVDNTNPDIENESTDVQDWKFLCRMTRYGISVGIPAGTMIPKGKDGLMIVSRAKGLGHAMSGCMRMKYDMEKSGEAAGVIAAIACKNKCSVRDVRYEEILPIIRESGCLNYNHDVGLCDLNEPYVDPENGRQWRKYPLPQSIEEYRQALSSREPGPTMWKIHCSDNDAELIDSLYAWMNSDNRLLAENCAVLLGMLGHRQAIPMLLDIISKPPVGYFFRVPEIKNIFGWPMESPFSNFTKAILLLGRFKEQSCVDTLDAIVADEGRAVSEGLVADEGFYDKETFAKQITAFARVALTDIKSV